MSSYKDKILNRLQYLFTILYNNNVKIDNLPDNLYKFKISKLLNLESQLLFIINDKNIDINNINTKQIYKNIKSNERTNILEELKKYLNMINDKNNLVYKNTNTLITYIEGNKSLDKNKIENDIDVIFNLIT